MLRGAWKPIAGAVAIGGPAYLYYASRSEKHQTFEAIVRVPGANGKSERVSKTFPLMPLASIESRINENVTSRTHTSPEGTSWKFTTASLASNDPIEDANASQIVHRDSTDPSAPGDYLFLAVMDGHSGRDTSQLLSKVLINAVALELNNLIKQPEAPSAPGILERTKSLIWSSATQPKSSIVASDPTQISRAIENAFVKLDTELVNAPIQVLANNLDQESLKKKIIPDLSKHPLALPTMLPAVSGSCAIMAVFDTAHRDLYVACTGDSRAVAGVWENTPDGQGQWRVEVLTEDQTGRNPNELKRMQSEHPADEANDVIRNGRVLGGLEPTRAFGDARYKWPREIQETLSQAFLVGNGRPLRPAPSLFRTPPYVTARPVVTHRKYTFDESGPVPEKALRFVVLATDGLWDELTSEEVVSLVGGHLTGLKGSIPKDDLHSVVRTSTGTSTVDGKEQRNRDHSGSWAFKDENPSAHLIRNAFGGGNEGILRQRLSIPAPYSRRYRDDITVTVVWWEEGNEKEANVATISDKLQAKL